MANQTQTIRGFLPICNQAREMLDLIHKGFARHNLDYLKDAGEIGGRIHEDSCKLTELLLEADNEGIKSFIPIPGYLERIGDELDSLVNCIRTKIRDGIMFSDRAVNEADALFKGILELLTCVGDCITTRNRVLAEHIDKEGERLGRLASEYATFHEERLISGVCIPKSAPVYLDILDSLRNIGWHLREVTRKILAGGDEVGKGD